MQADLELALMGYVVELQGYEKEGEYISGKKGDCWLVGSQEDEGTGSGN